MLAFFMTSDESAVVQFERTRLCASGALEDAQLIPALPGEKSAGVAIFASAGTTALLVPVSDVMPHKALEFFSHYFASPFCPWQRLTSLCMRSQERPRRSSR